MVTHLNQGTMTGHLRRARVILSATLATALVLPAAAAAQEATGRIAGRVVHAGTGQGITGVQIVVAGTTTGTLSGIDGRYSLGGVPAGTIDLSLRRLGFQPLIVTGIEVPGGDGVEQDLAMEPAMVQLSEVTVSAEAQGGSIAGALNAQRNAVNIVTAITNEQISRSPDGDAAAAMQRVSGVTVQDGKYLVVRGLGERYTTTSLNGARLPSPEPERKVVPLDLFPSGLLETIVASKNFTPDQPGDFSGAQVDIRTREFPASRRLSYSVGLGGNSIASGSSIVAPQSDGREWLGLAGSRRQLPDLVASFGDFSQQNPTQAEANAMVRSFRNIWMPQAGSASPNFSGSISLGGTDPILGRDMGYLASLSYSNSREVRDREVRGYPDATIQQDGGFRTIDRFEGQTGRNSVLWGGLLNFSTLVGTSSRLLLNNSYARTADNEARSEAGYSENLGRELLVDRLRFVSRSVRTNQLSGEHQIGDSHRIDWAYTNAGVSRDEPDRSEIVYTRDSPTSTRYWLDDPQSAARTFASLSEMSNSFSTDYRVQFGDPLRENFVKVGGLARHTSRDAHNRVYSIQAPTLGMEGRELDPQTLFDSYSNGSDAVFRVVPLSQGGSYGARDLLGAGYAMAQWSPMERLRVITGARIEYNRVELDAEPTIGAAIRTTPEFTDVLPSLALNYSLTDDQNLRLSTSRTLARPEYRELAPVQFRDVIGAENVRGNPDLVRTLVQNVDLRWEWYPSHGEVLSVALFGKRFDKPIEQVFRGTSGTRLITYANAREAVNYGVEFETRNSLRFIAPVLEPLSFVSNVTLMQSEISIGDNPNFQPVDRPMVGQAPYVVNAGLTWESFGSGTSATLLYNRVGRRIHSASEAPFPSVYDEARDVLDMSLRFPLPGGMMGKLDARNLLDEPYLRTQGNVVRESYYSGRSFSLGISWSGGFSP